MKKFFNGFTIVFSILIIYNLILNLISQKPIDLKEIIIFSTFLCSVLTIIHYARIKFKGYKFKDKAETVINAKYINRALEYCSKNDWKKIIDSKNKIVLRSKMNSLYSFGENIIFEKMGDNFYKVTSKPSFPLTIYDYGKSLDNIQFFKTLNR